jgi:acetyl esterase/lipase
MAAGRCIIFTTGGRLGANLGNGDDAHPLLAAAVLATLLASPAASAADYKVAMKSAIPHAERGGVRLVGDLYLPEGRSKAPVVVAFHGGAWRSGSRAFYRYWGPFLARNGYALFTVDYRLGKPGRYPAAVHDAKAAVQFVRAKADEFHIDAERIALMGDSAGGHLAALLALAADRFTAAPGNDANAAVPAGVKAVVGFYGIYDMLAQWNHDTLAEQRQEITAQRNRDLIPRPYDSITQQFLGASPTQNPRLYSESSPISYASADGAVVDRNKVRFLLINGARDELVDPESQSGAFAAVLTNAGFPVQRLVIPEAGHFWVSDPFEKDPQSFGAMAATPLLRFLDASLGALEPRDEHGEAGAVHDQRRN